MKFKLTSQTIIAGLLGAFIMIATSACQQSGSAVQEQFRLYSNAVVGQKAARVAYLIGNSSNRGIRSSHGGNAYYHPDVNYDVTECLNSVKAIQATRANYYPMIGQLARCFDRGVMGFARELLTYSTANMPAMAQANAQYLGNWRNAPGYQMPQYQPNAQLHMGDPMGLGQLFGMPYGQSIQNQPWFSGSPNYSIY